MLHALSGDTHSVITGVAIVIGNQEWVFHNETFVHFKTLSIHEIESYIDTGEPMDKAGAYGIQGKGALWVTGIEGSYTNVVGLPVEQVYDTLRQIFG
jgi:septum formation protein